MWVYYVVFLILLLLTILDIIDGLEDLKKFIKISLFFFLVLFAGLCGDISNDHINYIIIYDNYEGISRLFSNPSYYVVAEPGIDLIITVLNFFKISTINIFFISFSFIAVTLKFKSLAKISPFFFLSILIYFSNFYLLQEMTQIRTAIASGFLLWCIPDIVQKKKYPFLIKVALSTLIHYSSLIILPLYFFNPNKINRSLFSVIIIAAIVMSLLNVDIFTLLERLPLGLISAKIDKYNELMSWGMHVGLNKFNVFVILKLFLSFFLLHNIQVLQQKNEYAIIGLKIYITSIICFYLFSHVPAFAFRISELLGVVEIVMIPMLLLVIKEKVPALVTIVTYAILFISINLFYGNLLRPYF